MSPWKVAVIIPARDEETLLPRCLLSVLIAAEELPAYIATTIVVVSDSSTDRTAQIAERILYSRGHVLNLNAGTVGTARASAVAYALGGETSRLDRLWLANTDADCIVPSSWLVDQLRLADQGYEAIAGTVSVDSFDEHAPFVAERFRASYRIEADGSHQHVHGANIGVRADVYQRAGGWADLRTAEDHDLWRRLGQIGARTISTARVEVATSGRRQGRAPHGFADALAAHNECKASV